jgi:DNA polymerase-3 subunit epsilon
MRFARASEWIGACGIKHGALIDAQLLAQCYVELTGGRQIGLSLVSDLFDAAPVLAGTGCGAVSLGRPPAAPPRRELDELERHAAFVATLVDPIWTRLDASR